MEQVISSLDLGVIALYFIVVLLLGFWAARKTSSSDDLFLGGRTLTWGFIGLSLFASNISSTTIIGLTGAAYSSGIVQSVYEWISGIPLIIAAFIFVSASLRYLNAQITTIPEFLAQRFDRRSQVFFENRDKYFFLKYLYSDHSDQYHGRNRWGLICWGDCFKNLFPRFSDLASRDWISFIRWGLLGFTPHLEG